MISFKTFLAEVFGGFNVYKWTRESESEYEFKDDKGIWFTVRVDSLPYEKAYEILFGIIDDDDIRLSPSLNNNLKGALKIYNTVIDIVKHNLKSIKKGEKIIFSPENIRTSKIYERFAKIAAKEIGGTVSIDQYHGVPRFTVTKT